MTCAIPSSQAVGYGGDGAFVVARMGFAHDVAMLPDASVLVSTMRSSDSAPTRRLWPDGRRADVDGLDATGLAVAPDGSVLAVDGTSNVVRRWVPGGQPSIVAGSGAPGFGGDGGPAAAAQLLLSGDSWGIVPLAAGGFVFADSNNQLIRAVDAAGVIATGAGAPPGSLEYPTGLAPWHEGGYVVADQNRLRLLRDGRLETLVGSEQVARDVESLADGTVLWTGSTGRLSRLSPNARRPALLLRSGARRLWDFAARSVSARGISSAPRGGLLIASDGGVVYIPNGPTRWPLVALRNTRIGQRRLTAVLETTRAGTASLELLRHGHVVGHVRRSVRRGHARLALEQRPSDRFFTVRVELRVEHAAVVHDQVRVLAARALSIARAGSLLAPGPSEDSVVSSSLGRCERLGPRRVDCEIREHVDRGAARSSDTCERISSAQLRASGIVVERAYACGNRRRGEFRRHPDWDARAGVKTPGPSDF